MVRALCDSYGSGSYRDPLALAHPHSVQGRGGQREMKKKNSARGVVYSSSDGGEKRHYDGRRAGARATLAGASVKFKVAPLDATAQNGQKSLEDHAGP